MREKLKAILAMICVTAMLVSFPFMANRTRRVSLDVDSIMDNVVHIYADAGWQGSGFWIDDNVIVTARHVVDGTRLLRLTDKDGAEAISDNVLVDEDMDCALIFVGMSNHSHLLMAETDEVNYLDTCYIVGHPFGDYRFNITKGIISNPSFDFFDDFFGTDIVFQSDAASYPGNSGGPVLNEKGRVIGILVGGIIGTDNMSFIVPIRHVRELLQEIK